MLKFIAILLGILLALVLIVPFILNMFGVPILQVASVAGEQIPKGIMMQRSTDGGATWEEVRISRGERSSFPGIIFDVAFHPQNPDVLFMGTKGSGLWMSEDGGISWKKVVDRARVLDPKSDVYQLAIHPRHANVLYMTVLQKDRGIVLKSIDGGESFKEIYFVPLRKIPVFGVAVHPFDPDVAVVTTGQGGILESRNGGRTWRLKTWFGEAMKSLRINPVLFEEMYAVSNRGALFKTFDGGESWINISMIRARTIYSSSDERYPAQVLFVGEPYPPRVTINPFDPLGLSENNSFETFVIDPYNPATLYIGARDGIFRSRDGGFSWEKLPVLIPPDVLPVTALAIDRLDSRRIFAAAASQLHQSEDGGVQWSVQTLPFKTVRKLLIHPMRPKLMIAVLGR